MRCLLIDTGARKILIDTGTGSKQTDYLKLYGMKDIISFETELNKIGLQCSDITDVVLTHLHFDHCGGCTQYDENKNIVLTFPNAYYWVGSAQWNNFLNPNVREGDSYFSENMIPVKDAGRLKLVTENIRLCQEVELRIYNGHTVGQLVSYIDVQGKSLVYVGDVIPVSANVPLAWVSAYDTYPINSMTEKKILMDDAIANNRVLFFEHDAYTECCTVTENNGKYKVEQGFSLEEFLNA
jgi:glyoxylase-like metal-dependent hydrolase (beta-lactamase superfamily II)